MTDVYDRDRLVETAMTNTGLDDFGEPSWQEGLDLLLDDYEHEARLNELGVGIATGDLVGNLSRRLELLEWRKQHPDETDGPITQPIFIVGQPRTGTTILYDLLAQDPRLRAPLSWEVDLPVPPPEPATFETDPRIAEVDATLEMTNLIIPGFTDFHPLGAQLAQECVRITSCDFRSMIFNTQFRVPNYENWLLDETSMASSYRFHHKFLQHLQSKQAPQHWLLKSPAHMWSLADLIDEYPDAIVIQNHRDPLKVVASVSALVAHLRQMASDETSVADAAAEYTDHIYSGLERSMAARDDGTLAPDRVIDVQFSEFMDDTFGTIDRIYREMGLELTAEAETRMRAFLDEHPGDGGGGGTRYRFADTGLNADELRERAAPYQERFGVVSEPVR